MTPTDVVEQYFKAMQAGESAADALFALFADDAVYTEPFSGTPRTHTGRSAVEAFFRESWQNPLPDVRIEIRRIDVDGPVVRTAWTCHSPAFEGPMQGHDECTVQGGKITRLEVTLG